MKKVAVNTVKKFMKENAKPTEHVIKRMVEDSEFTVVVKTKLTLDEKSLFVKRVISACFDANGNYRPEYFEPMVKSAVLQIATNLPPISMKVEGVEEQTESILDIDAMATLYDLIKDEVMENIYWEMEMICQDRIHFEQDLCIAKLKNENGAFERVMKLSEDFMEEIKSAANKINDPDFLTALLNVSDVAGSEKVNNVIKMLDVVKKE